jgi:MFS family permease
MDSMGRKRMWMLCLTAAAAFTGMTYFVTTFWQLTAMRMLASRFAMAELAVSITIVNEQVPARYRGLLYSLVQGGWPVGVFLASGVYLLFGDLGWQFVFPLGVIPIVMVIIGRMFIRESDRFLHLREVKEALAAGDEVRVRWLLEEYHVDVAELGEATVRQLFGSPGYVRRQLLLLAGICLVTAPLVRRPTSISRTS